MQTFLPYEDFHESARILDNKRLGKQRVETLQILRSLTGPGGLRGGWQAHPAARMWKGHLAWLMEYQRVFCYEWRDVRGFKDTCYQKTLADLKRDPESFAQWETIQHGRGPEQPWFVASDVFRFTHRANLVRKQPEFYIPLFGPLRPDIPYAWTPETIAELAKEYDL